MTHKNIEIKASSKNHAEIREILKSKNAEFKGVDNQIDTYFNTKSGRLKLREGNIENHLIQYNRENKSGPKQSDIILYKPAPGSNLKEILMKSMGILVVVAKKREIYFIDNVKFHLDSVGGLGTFVEIEAIDSTGYTAKEHLFEQCTYYCKLFKIKSEDLIAESYCDLLLAKN